MADELPGSEMPDLRLTMNRIEKQRLSTSHMAFKIDTPIDDISRGISLKPYNTIEVPVQTVGVLPLPAVAE